MTTRKINGKLLAIMFTLHNESTHEGRQGQTYLVHMNERWINEAVTFTEVGQLLPILRNTISLLVGDAQVTAGNWFNGTDHYRMSNWTVIESESQLTKPMLSWINALPRLSLANPYEAFGDRLLFTELTSDDIHVMKSENVTPMCFNKPSSRV